MSYVNTASGLLSKPAFSDFLRRSNGFAGAIVSRRLPVRAMDIAQLAVPSVNLLFIYTLHVFFLNFILDNILASESGL